MNSFDVTWLKAGGLQGLGNPGCLHDARIKSYPNRIFRRVNVGGFDSNDVGQGIFHFARTLLAGQINTREDDGFGTAGDLSSAEHLIEAEQDHDNGCRNENFL